MNAISCPYLYLAILVITRTSMGFQFQSVGSLSLFIMNELEIAFATLGTLIGLFMLARSVRAWDEQVALMVTVFMVFSCVFGCVSGINRSSY
ncbi:MAG: hypothetical protein VB913_12290 [Rhodospirillales bacterium]